MRATQKRGSVPGLVPTLALLRSPSLSVLDDALPDDGTAFSPLGRPSSRFPRRQAAADAGAKVDKCG
jgi:hypothetical protein